MTSNEDGAAARSLAKIEAIESTENVNDVERMRSTISEEVENKDTEIDGSVSVEKNPEQVSAINGAIHDTSEEKIAPEPSEEQDDPWCHKGKLSCILRNTPNAIVYSLVDHVKLIDKDLIIRLVAKAAVSLTSLFVNIGLSYYSDQTNVSYFMYRCLKHV
ncbi:hypothetical protein HJC23_011636 [Cyclotella cryptica]|uniref:Uncharacterized protein n=1 Tax=Cyclotella cryptica TaxID=29204 RepID=A0ABD3QRI9_9STRA